jgi:hypothetical protein
MIILLLGVGRGAAQQRQGKRGRHKPLHVGSPDNAPYRRVLNVNLELAT